MTVYVQIGDFLEVTTKTALINYQTDGAYINTTNVRSGVTVNPDTDSNAYFHGPTFSASNLWVHFVLRCSRAYWNGLVAPAANTSMVRIMAGGTQRIRLVPYSEWIIKLEKWNGSSWDVLGTYNHPLINSGLICDSRNTWDIHATVGASSNIVVYLNNTVIIAASGVDTTFGGTVSAFDNVIFSNPGWASQTSGADARFSEILCTDWNTVGSKIVVKAPDANGGYAQWTNGDYTVVDEIYGGTDYATSPTADQRVDWSMGSFPNTTANEIIPSVKLVATLNRDLVGPQQANFYIRRNSTDYDNTDMSLQLVQQPESKTYTTDPATGDVWTVANLNASTFGLRSRT